MDSHDGRKFLNKHPESKAFVEKIFLYFGMEYDKHNNWELRTVKTPNESAPGGELITYKLYINKNFEINVYPLTSDLIDTANQRYQMTESLLVKNCRNKRIALSQLIQVIRSGIKTIPDESAHVYFTPLTQAIDNLLLARNWLGQELKRNTPASPYPASLDPGSTDIIEEADVGKAPKLEVAWHSSKEANIQNIKQLRFELTELNKFVPNGAEEDRAKMYIQNAIYWLGTTLASIIGGKHCYWLDIFHTTEVSSNTTIIENNEKSASERILEGSETKDTGNAQGGSPEASKADSKKD